MNTDSYYEIGTSHIVCEDHAIHGEYEGLHYVIGADGCSSSEGVELGSALLCHVAKKQIMQLHKSSRLFELFCQTKPAARDIATILETAIVQNCLDLKSSLKLGRTAFDATLWIAVSITDLLFVFGWGDGVMILKDKDGTHTTVRRYDSNAPYYLSYQMDYQRNQDYNNMEFKGKLNESWELGTEREFTNIYDANQSFYYTGRKSMLKSVTICSDGIETYRKSDAAAGFVKTSDVAVELTDYKNLVGSFVERRMLKLKKVHKEQNIVHLDDVFCATINLEE